MMFISNWNIAIGVFDDLWKAEFFYGGVLGFKLLGKTSGRLVYDAGHFTLYVNNLESYPSVPSRAA